MEVHGPGFIGFHMFWLLPLLMIFAVGVTVLVIWAIRESGRPHPAGPPRAQVDPMPFQTGRETPLDILARRFAAGEITAEEYQKARDLLQGGGKA